MMADDMMSKRSILLYDPVADGYRKKSAASIPKCGPP
jgi:hypothetical protein